MRVVRPILLASFLAFLPHSAAHAGAIINGGFEAPDIAAGSFAVFGAIPGWATVSGSGIEIQDHVAGSPFEGAQFVELDSFGNSAMEQGGIPTIPLKPYELSFAYSPRSGYGAGTNGIEVFFNGLMIASLAQSGVGHPDTSWTVFSFLVAPLTPTSQVRFTATGTSDSLGGYIDDVQLSAVPEPASLALLGLAFVGLGAVRRRLP